jgi:hypothetical protein
MADPTQTAQTTATKRSTAAKKASATRRRTATKRTTTRATRATTRSATRTAQSVAPKTPVELVQSYAEKAVVIPVGAALVARDNLIATVEDLRGRYATVEAAQRTIGADLKKFERRGTRARKNVEREMRKARTRLERTLRQNRRRARRQATTYRKDAENLVQSGVNAGAGIAERVSERVGSIS